MAVVAPLAFGFPQGAEWLIIVFVALLVFGKRLPGVARSLGQGVTEFKKGLRGIQDATLAEDEVVKPLPPQAAPVAHEPLLATEQAPAESVPAPVPPAPAETASTSPESTPAKNG